MRHGLSSRDVLHEQFCGAPVALAERVPGVHVGERPGGGGRELVAVEARPVDRADRAGRVGQIAVDAGGLGELLHPFATPTVRYSPAHS